MSLLKLRLHFSRNVAIAAFSCIFLLLLTTHSSAQNQTIVSGTVTDESGKVLPNTSVTEKGTMNGTTTDAEGKYQLSVDKKASLVVSFSGFKTVELPVNNATNLNATLRPDLQQLDNVVVTGYGTQRRKEITSSVVTVGSKDFIKGNVADPLQLLQGKVSGLQIGRAGGNPNQPFTIRLRGLNTISGDASPLIVIDGVLGGALDALDPNDIESIEVLKDASAAAIYGARASAGVVIVTTRTGKGISKPQLNYSGQVSFENISKVPLVANAAQYKELGGQDLGANTDWMNEVTKTGFSQVHNLSFGNTSAGGLSYNASINYRNVDGVIKNASTYDQLNMRLNISQRFLDNKVVLYGSVATTSRKEDQGYQQTIVNALYYNPTAPIYDSLGNFYETKVQDRYNPVAINEQNVRDRILNRQVANIRAEVRPFKRITLSGTYTLQKSSELLGEYSKRQSYFGGLLVNGWARRETNESSYEQFDGAITYTGESGKLRYVITAGNSYNYENIQSHAAANSDFITDEFSYNNLAAGQGINKNGVVAVEGNVAQPQNFVGSGQRESISNAYFIRANLNYDDAFFLSGSYRREGSSRFGPNNRWGNFWALSGGVDIARAFDLKVDQLKLRAGYGITGTLPNVFYGYLATLELTNGGYANGQFISGITPATAYNPDLKWEEKAELNLGVDFGLFGKLTGSFDIFNRKTSDLLNVVDVPSPPNPVSQQLQNVGELETKGVELQLSFAAKKTKDFSWTIDANFSTAKTVLVEFNNKSDQTILRSDQIGGVPAFGGISPIWTIQGQEIGQIYAQPFVKYGPNGDAIVLSKDKTEMVFSATTFQDNAIHVADALPDFYAGLGNTFGYKNFDLNFFFRGAFGHSLVDEPRAAFENTSGISGRNLIITEGEFDKSIITPSYSTRYVEKASFVKLDNATIGYTFPIKNQKVLRSIRLYATGQNLLTFTGYKGADPDVRYFDPPNNGEGRRGNSFYGNGLFPGMDRFITFPPTRTYTFGINIGI